MSSKSGNLFCPLDKWLQQLMLLIIFALIIISQHWIGLIVGAILIVLLFLAMIEEEKRDIEKFGDAYRDYMNRVPRINLIAGIIKQIHGKREDKD